MIKIKSCFHFLLLFCFWQNNLSAQEKTNKIIDSSINVLQTTTEDTIRLQALMQICFEYTYHIWPFDMGKEYANELMTKAKELLNKAPERSNEFKVAKRGIAYAHRILGQIISRKYFVSKQKRLNDSDVFDSIIINQRVALNIFEELNDKYVANMYDEIGDTHGDFYVGSKDSAVIYYAKAIKKAKEMDMKPEIAQFSYHQALFLYEKENYFESLPAWRDALKLYAELGNKTRLIVCYEHIGLVYIAFGLYPEAQKNLFESLKIAENIDAQSWIASVNGYLGDINTSLKKFPEALKNYTTSLNIYNARGALHGIANSYLKLSIFYNAQGNLSESFKNAEIALARFREINRPLEIEQCHIQLGEYYLNIGKYREAKEEFLTSLASSEKWGNRKNAIICAIKLSKCLLEEAISGKRSSTDKNFKDALNYLDKALQSAKQIGLKEEIKNIFEMYSRVYSAMKDHEKAFEYSTFYIQLKDSLLNNEITRKLEQQRIQYEVEKAVAEEKIQQEKVLAEQKFQNEKKLAEENTKHQLAIVEEQAKKEKALAIAKLKYDFALATAKTEEERLLADQEFENETKLAAENVRHQQLLSEEKTKQEIKDAEARAMLEKEKATKQKRTEGFIAGLIGLALTSVFAIIIIRQRNQKTRAVEKAEAGHKMAELELQSLRAQLNPHFMFNSLNAIQDLILKEDNDRSHLYLSRFSKLLRMLLDNADQPFVSVKQEIEFLELYLSLENLRIPDLQFSIEKDPKINTEVRMVPNMMLQPYIENAIWHGLSNKKGERKLQIRIHENGNVIQFEIEDNGIGRKKATELKSLYRKGHTSKGMELLSKRFNLLSKEYGASIQATVTDLGNGEASGTLVKIDVPFSLSEHAKRSAHDTNYNN